MVRQMVRLTCSYQHAMDAPKAIGGHTRRGATRRITYCVAAPASSSGTGKYGCSHIIYIHPFIEQNTAIY